jgi:lysophospholipase
MAEAQLSTAYGEVIGPFWNRQAQPITCRSNVDGLELRGVACLQPSRETAIIVSNGRTESFLKYKEVIYDLYTQGHSVFIVDHRGQGLSGRLLAGEAKKQMGHVRDFHAAVLSSPMFELVLNLPNGLTEDTFDWNALTGHEEEYAPDSHGYDENATFQGDKLTHSEIRWNLMRREYERNPEAKLGGPSVLWVKLALGGGQGGATKCCCRRGPCATSTSGR